MTDRLTGDQKAMIQTFMASQSTLALATLDRDSRPQVAPLFYVSDEALHLYWLSSATSRHSVNLGTQTLVAVTIYPDLWDWAEIRGLQIEGQAAAVTDSPLRDRVLRQYRRKFPLPVSLDSRIASSTLYRLTPHWMRWLDNRVSFSYKREFSL